MRYFLEISYKGTHYHGWQVQENAITVQGSINEALSKILDTKILTQGSGRTDSGVHALQQFAHFDTEKNIDQEKLLLGLNGNLPNDIVIRSINKARDPEFNARFGAEKRSYLYRITRSRDPFRFEEAAFINYDLDIGLMNEASNQILGKHDFTSFSKINVDQEGHECEIFSANWSENFDAIHFEIDANRFLRGMVRILVGTLLQVGQKKIGVKEFESILLSKDRNNAGAAAPGQGLYLQKVVYPEGSFE